MDPITPYNNMSNNILCHLIVSRDDSDIALGNDVHYVI